MRENWSTLKKLIWMRGSPAGGGSETYGPADIVSFMAARAKKLKELTVTMQPIQDLNGYDAPWPAGGGANKLLLSTSAKSGTVDGVTYSYDPTTEKISLSGTNENTTSHALRGFSKIADGLIVPDFQVGETYTLLAYLPTSMYCQLVYKDENNTNIAIGYMSGMGALSSVTFTIPDDYASFYQIQTYVRGTATSVSGEAYFEIVSGSTAPTAWTPYSNLCPILGRTGASAWRTGVNLLDGTAFRAYSNWSDSAISYGSMFSNSSNRVFMLNTKVGAEHSLSFGFTSESFPEYLTLCRANGVDTSEIVKRFTTSSLTVTSKTFTAEAGWIYYLRLGNTFSEASFNTQIALIPWEQLELGTATDYAPYQGNLFSVVFPALGKNLYSREGSEYNVPVYAQDGTQASYQDVAVWWFKAKPNTKYTLSMGATPSSTTYIRWINCDEDKGFISRPVSTYNNTQLPLTITTPNDCYWVEIAINEYGAAQISQNDWKLQIEEGSSATSYEDFTNTVYSGTVDIVTGVLTVDMASLTKNTADMNNSDSYPGWKSSGCRSIIGANINGRVPGAFTNISPVSLGGSGGVIANTLASNDILILNRGDINRTQVEWIALAIDVQFMLPLATPILFHCDPQTVLSLAGSNNIWSPDGQVTVKT